MSPTIEAMTQAGRAKLAAAKRQADEQERLRAERRQAETQANWAGLCAAVRDFVPAELLPYADLTLPVSNDVCERISDKDFSTNSKFDKDARGWILCVRIPGYAPIDFACVRYGEDGWTQGRFRRHAHDRLWRTSGFCAEWSRDGESKYVGTNRDNMLYTDDVEEALAFAAEAEQQRLTLQAEVDTFNAERTRKNAERVQREEAKPTLEMELADVLRRFVQNYAPSGE